MRILLVDDESSIRSLLRRMLEPEGFEVVEAGDGVAALDRVSDQRPDLVITDMLMPRMGGRELITRLRGDPEVAAIPILVVSAEQGADTYAVDAAIAKPFKAEEVLGTVRSLIGWTPG